MKANAVHWYSLTMSRRQWGFWIGVAYAILAVIEILMPPVFYLLKLGGY